MIERKLLKDYHALCWIQENTKFKAKSMKDEL